MRIGQFLATVAMLGEDERKGQKGKDTHRNPRKCAAAGIGRSLDAVSGPWFVMLFNGGVLGVAMHVLRPHQAPQDWLSRTLTGSVARRYHRLPYAGPPPADTPVTIGKEGTQCRDYASGNPSFFRYLFKSSSDCGGHERRE